MSSLYTLFNDFKEHLKIRHHILTTKPTEKKCTITIYCKQDDINVKKQLDAMNFFFVKYNLMKMSFYPFDPTKLTQQKCLILLVMRLIHSGQSSCILFR